MYFACIAIIIVNVNVIVCIDCILIRFSNVFQMFVCSAFDKYYLQNKNKIKHR